MSNVIERKQSLAEAYKQIGEKADVEKSAFLSSTGFIGDFCIQRFCVFA